MSPILLQRLRQFVDGQAICSGCSLTGVIYGHPASLQRGNVLRNFLQVQAVEAYYDTYLKED